MAKKSHSPVRCSPTTKRPKVGVGTIDVRQSQSGTGVSPRLSVTPLRVWGGGTAALLYLNLAMIEAEFAKHLRRLGSPKAQAADEATAFTDKFVPVFAEVIERRLNLDLTTGALGFQMLGYEHRTEFLEQRLDGVLSFLNALVSQNPSWLPDLLALPLMRIARRQIEKRGTQAQKSVLKRLLRRATTAKGGRPLKLPKDRADVTIAKEVEEAHQRLADRGKALRSVASQRGSSVASVRSAAWRGRQRSD